MRVILSLITFIFVFFALSCSSKSPWEKKSPEDALQNFLMSVESQNREVVWEFLNHEDQAKLTQLAKDLEGFEGKDMLNFGHVISSTREYKKFELISQDKDNAVVAVVLHDQSQIKFQLAKGNQGRWTVDLPLEMISIP